MWLLSLLFLSRFGYLPTPDYGWLSVGVLFVFGVWGFLAVGMVSR
jgi:hypothetical protein